MYLGEFLRRMSTGRTVGRSASAVTTMNASKFILKLQRTDADGFILIAVLWILGALSVLASIYAVYVINTASAFAAYDNHLKTEVLVSAALELTAYRQQTAGSQARPPHGQFEFRLGEANVAVEFRSEAARIDLNKAPKELLAALFVSLGASPEEANLYSDRIVGWRTPPSKGVDSETSSYQFANLGYQPRGAAFPRRARKLRRPDEPDNENGGASSS